MLDIVYSPAYLSYNFGAQHPFSPDRWEALEALLRIQVPQAAWVDPAGISESTLQQVHTLPYLEAVHAASAGFPGTHSAGFGLNTQDVPVFFGMHEASLAHCSGSVAGAIRIARAGATKVLQLGGGLHHAMPERAAGFCVYNDVAMAIQSLRAEGLRVAYVDIDVHHGDGVQAVFYQDPDVLTISLHEDGRFLFPGTGFVQERGSGPGRGAAVNIPLHPGTGDAEWLDAFDTIVPRVIESFSPDVFVVEAGADAHFRDPLASLALTTRGFEAAIDRLVRLSDHHAKGRLLATLGGGYHFDSTIRQWFILACRLAGIQVPEAVDPQWKAHWEARCGFPLSSRVHDPDGPATESGSVLEQNATMLDELQRLLDRTE